MTLLLCEFYIFVISIISLIFIWSNYLSLLENKKLMRKLKKINFPILIKRPVSPNKARREQNPNRPLRARLLSRLHCAFAFPRLWNAPGVRPSPQAVSEHCRERAPGEYWSRTYGGNRSASQKGRHPPDCADCATITIYSRSPIYAYRFHWLICLSSPLHFPTAPRLLI